MKRLATEHRDMTQVGTAPRDAGQVDARHRNSAGLQTTPRGTRRLDRIREGTGRLYGKIAGALGLLLLACLQGHAASTGAVPGFKVDPFWPKPLPHHWVLGPTVGVAVDARDHIWIIHRPGKVDDEIKGAAFSPPRSVCCVPAPPVLEFDQAGNLLQAWGGPAQGYEWPDSEHGITVDYQDHVWISGNGPGDTEILKFTADGKFLLQIGKKGVHGGDDDVRNVWRAASMFVDKSTNEVYVADGYGNHRVIVFDATTGEHKRHWGAYGTHDFPPPVAPGASSAAKPIAPSDAAGAAAAGPGTAPSAADIVPGTASASAGASREPASGEASVKGAPGAVTDAAEHGAYDPTAPLSKQFKTVHCAILSSNGLLYVCDRLNNRIQVFKPDGTYLKEQQFSPATLRTGSVWDIAFSRDPAQSFLYVADGANEVVNVVRRDTLQAVGSFGDGGRQPGEFFGVHNIATDSKGNIYTTETYTGARVQRFLFKGLGPPRPPGVAAVWPSG